MDNVIGEATAEFRNIRKMRVTQTNNFEITKSDAIAQTLFENLAIYCLGGYCHWCNYFDGCIHWPDEYYVGFCY